MKPETKEEKMDRVIEEHIKNRKRTKEIDWTKMDPIWSRPKKNRPGE